MSVLPRMPDFASPHRIFQHSLGSALESLEALGIPEARIFVRSAGPVGPEGRVMRQRPDAGEVLHEDEFIELTVAGLGMFYSIPGGMREADSQNRRMGTREIVELFDDPLERAGYLISEGERLFDIAPDNLPACARWIRLFGVDPGEWPETVWHSLAILLPALHKTAGTEAGIRLTLEMLFQIPVESYSYLAVAEPLPESVLLRLGGAPRQLGLDTIIGNCLEEPAGIRLVLGPVPLGQYLRFQQAEDGALLGKSLRLCVPFYQQYSLAWSVLDRSVPACLGDPRGTTRLGVNTYLGNQAAAGGQSA